MQAMKPCDLAAIGHSMSVNLGDYVTFCKHPILFYVIACRSSSHVSWWLSCCSTPAHLKTWELGGSALVMQSYMMSISWCLSCLDKTMDDLHCLAG